MVGLDRRLRRGTQDDKLPCPVGTAFMPSGDSSPCGVSISLRHELTVMRGDESPDGINAVPTSILLQGDESLDGINVIPNIVRNRVLGIFSLPGGSKLEEGRSDDKACA
jgi:hypothetical protein